MLADAEFYFLPSFIYENSNQPNYAMHLSYNETQITYTSPAYHRTFGIPLLADYIEQSDVLIIGGHGGDGSFTDYPCDLSNLKTVLVANTEKTKIPPGGAIDSAQAEILKEIPYYEVELD